MEIEKSPEENTNNGWEEPGASADPEDVDMEKGKNAPVSNAKRPSRVPTFHIVPSADTVYYFESSGKIGKNGSGELMNIGTNKYRVKVRNVKRRYWECTVRHCPSKAITEGPVLCSYIPDHSHDSSRTSPPVMPARNIRSRSQVDIRAKVSIPNGDQSTCTVKRPHRDLSNGFPHATPLYQQPIFPAPIPVGMVMVPGSSSLKPLTVKSEQVPSREDEVLLEPFEYVKSMGGKGIREKLTQAFNYWLKVPQDKLLQVTEVVQMLHNASLIIDDIEDSSSLRRGRPAAHMIYGTPLSINSANYIYFLALEKVLTFEHPQVTCVFTEQMLELHRGQGMDIYWRDSFTCPTEEEYKQMVIRKTGGLFGLAIRLMQLFSENKSNFKPLIDCLGLIFQIRDDYANLVDTAYHAAKTYCEDLTEGKYSFPIVHAIRSHPEDHLVASVLRQRTEDLNVKRHCVRHLRELGALEYTRSILLDLEANAFRLINEHGGNLHLALLLEELGKLYRSEFQPADQ